MNISAQEGLGFYELMKHKPWYDKGCSKLLYHRKPSKLQLLQDPSEVNGENLNNVRCEARRHFRNKERECVKYKINELAMNIKNKNMRDLYKGISEHKRGYRPSSNLVKGENCDLIADTHNILSMWKHYFSQLLNVHNVSDIRQIEIHTAEPLVPGPRHLEVETAVAKLKNYKSPGSDQILPELIQALGETLRIHQFYLE
jgi:hypothetical protein